MANKETLNDKIEKLTSKINGHEQARESLIERARQIITAASEKEAQARQAYLDAEGEHGTGDIEAAIAAVAAAHAEATSLERQAEGLQHLIEGLTAKREERRAELRTMEEQEARARLEKLDAEWDKTAEKLVAIGGRIAQDRHIVGLDLTGFWKLKIPMLTKEASHDFNSLLQAAGYGERG